MSRGEPWPRGHHFCASDIGGLLSPDTSGTSTWTPAELWPHTCGGVGRGSHGSRWPFAEGQTCSPGPSTPAPQRGRQTGAWAGVLREPKPEEPAATHTSVHDNVSVPVTAWHACREPSGTEAARASAQTCAPPGTWGPSGRWAPPWQARPGLRSQGGDPPQDLPLHTCPDVLVLILPDKPPYSKLQATFRKCWLSARTDGSSQPQPWELQRGQGTQPAEPPLPCSLP